MTDILKSSTCQHEESRNDQLAERFQGFRTREFWDKPQLERSQIAAEWLKKRMNVYLVSAGQLKTTRSESILLLSWDEIHAINESREIRMPFTKGNFAEVIEKYSMKE